MRQIVPTMQGRIPPRVMESMGGWVKNVHEIARHPLETMNQTMMARAAALIRAAVRREKNPTV
jgi:hypothetical protein